jgi:PEP-CTERM motif
MEGALKQSTLISCVAAIAALSTAGAASAADLITNGGFETNNGNGQLGDTTTATGWSVPTPTTNGGSYVFLYNASATSLSGTTADTIGGNGVFGNVALWGPDNGGGANGLTVSPDGGAFIASNPSFHNGPISQTITGLTKGAQYVLTFDWAGAQQSGFGGATSEGWQVSFAGVTQDTSPAQVMIANKGFSGWMTQSLTFTADGTSDVLSFLAVGGPNSSEPPFALLDGVSLVSASTRGAPVPEPAAWTLMLVGVGALGAGLRMRRRQALAGA